MSTLSAARTHVLNLRPLHSAIQNAEGEASYTVQLETDDLWRLDGDNRWRMIMCVRGEIWVTQERDVRDYVLEAGDMFIVSQSGSVLIEALRAASVQITPSLKMKPYRGAYPVFH